MRLSDQQVKELLRHEERDVRAFALHYFSNSYSTDPTVMPIVIEQFQQRGYEKLFGSWSAEKVAQLQQTSATIEWALGTLESADPLVLAEIEEDLTESIDLCAQYVVDYADASLTFPFRARIDKLMRKSNRGLLRNLQDRWDLLDSSVENLWNDMTRKVRKARRAGKWPTVPQFVEALARHPEAMKPRVLEGLRTAVENQDFDSLEYAMSAILVDIAGQARLNEAAELISRTFELDTDIDNEMAVRALVRLGSPEAVAAVEQRILDGVVATRWYGPAVFGEVHSDEAIATGLRLLERCLKEDHETFEELAHRLLSQPSHEVLDAVYAQLCELETVEGDYWEARRDCVRLGKVLERELPLFRSWAEAMERPVRYGSVDLSKITSYLRQILELDAKPLTMDVRDPSWLEHDSQVIDIAPSEGAAQNRIAESQYASVEEVDHFDSWSEPSAPAADRYSEQQPLRVSHLPGRNDPCPCGSGKKFKKCCLGNSVVRR